MGSQIPIRLPAVSLDRAQYLTPPMTEPRFQMVVVVEGRLDEARLRRALRLAMDAEPVFGCRYVASRWPHWKRRDDLDSLSLCEVIESSDVRQVLTEFSARPHDAAFDPLLQACLVRGTTDTLCVRLSHCAADAAGFKDVLNLIASIYRSLGNDPDYRVTPNLGSRSLMQLFRHIGLGKCLRLWWRYIRKHRSGVPRHQNEWRFPANPGQSGEVRYAIRRLGPGRFDAMRAYAKARGATLNDVFLTAYFRSLFQFLDPQVSTPQRVAMPMDLRRFLPSGKTEAACNFITLFHIALARVPEESFEGTLKRVSESSKKSEERTNRALFGIMMAAFAFRLAHPQVRRGMLRAHRRSIEDGRTAARMTNVGTLAPDQMDFGLPVADAYMISVPAGAPSVLLAAVSFRKNLSFDVSYSSRAIQPEVMESFLDHFIEQLPAANVAPESQEMFAPGGAGA